MPRQQAAGKQQLPPEQQATADNARGKQYLRALQINQALQQTLKIDSLLEIFAEELQKDVPFDGFHFAAESNNVDFKIGQPGKHSATYHLNLLDEELGQITITRNHVFKESELMNIEYYLTSLLYPLRNAIHYNDALHCSLLDSLTQVGNRRALTIATSKEIEIAKRHQQQLSMLMLDLDHFKQLNDALGHLKGDAVIVKIAQTIKATVRESDIVFRYGGDEFIVLLIGTDLTGAGLLAERLREAINYQLSSYRAKYSKTVGELSTSIGIATFTPKDDTHSLIERADRALYAAKHAGKNQISIDDATAVK